MRKKVFKYERMNFHNTVTGEQPAQVNGQQAPSEQQAAERMDTQSFAKAMQEAGKKALEKQFRRELSEKFGTDSIEDLHEQWKELQEVKQSRQSAKQQESAELQKYKSEFETLAKELASQKQKEMELVRKNSVVSYLNAAGIEFLNPRAQDLMVSEFMSRYKVADGGVVNSIDDIPQFSPDKTRLATVADVIRDMAKQPDFTGFLKSESKLKHPDTSRPGQDTAKGYMPTAQDRMNPRFVMAAKATDQWNRMGRGEPVDLDKIKTAMARMPGI